MTEKTHRVKISQFFKDRHNPLLKALQPSVGFTFRAEGISTDQFTDKLKLISRKDRKSHDRLISETVWVHSPTSLEARVDYVYYSDSNVLEMSGSLTNRGRKTIKHVKGPIPLSFALDVSQDGTPRTTTVYGGAPTDGDYPPKAYAVSETDGVRILEGGREGGRSTDSEMPYMIMTDPGETCGLFFVLEWPGSWRIVAFNHAKGNRRVIACYAEVACTDFSMQPGDSIDIPRANLGFFRGNAIAGSNALRRHIRKHVHPGGPSFAPPVFYNHYFGLRRDWTVRDQIAEARKYAQLGVEYYVVDAEWFRGTFRGAIGNWELEDKRRFPDGMAAFADYVRSLGMKFGSWLEIEFAMKGSHWARKHPDWFDRVARRPDPLWGVAEYKDMLLRLGDERVRLEVADFLERWVNKYGIEWLRWDFNNSPAPFWEAHETPGQFGPRQLAYAQGLYALLDEFMARCPEVHIEACASGGHRMDMGTLRRAHSAWMNDNTDTHNPIRRFQGGLNRVVPGCYGNSTFLWATHPHQRSQSLTSLKTDGYPPAVLRSRMGGTLGFAENCRFYTPAIKAYLKKEINNYKAQRHLLMQDFYPLFNPQRMTDYDGWQFHDPDTGEGFFQVFRCDSPSNRTEVLLPGLSPGIGYELTDIDSGKRRRATGGRNMRVSIPEPSGVKWYQYRAR